MTIVLFTTILNLVATSLAVVTIAVNRAIRARMINATKRLEDGVRRVNKLESEMRGTEDNV